MPPGPGCGAAAHGSMVDSRCTEPVPWGDITSYMRLLIVEPPFGLRLLLPFWCRRGGGIGARLVRGKGK